MIEDNFFQIALAMDGVHDPVVRVSMMLQKLGLIARDILNVFAAPLDDALLHELCACLSQHGFEATRQSRLTHVCTGLIHLQLRSHVK